MEWNKKVSMLLLAKNQRGSKKEKEAYQEFIKQNIHDFDSEAWDMFTHSVVIDKMREDATFWQVVDDAIEAVLLRGITFSTVSAYRVEMIRSFWRMQKIWIINNKWLEDKKYGVHKEKD